MNNEIAVEERYAPFQVILIIKTQNYQDYSQTQYQDYAS